MRRFLLSIVLLALVSAVAAAADRRLIVYRDPFAHGEDTGEFFDLAGKGWGARSMNIIWPIKFCPASSPYHCLYSDYIGFALSAPKRDLPVGSTWRVGKFRFVIRDVGVTRFAGRKLNATVIDTIMDGAPQDHAQHRATYDPKYGLVCYASLNWKDHKTGAERSYAEVMGLACAEDIGLWPRGQ